MKWTEQEETLEFFSCQVNPPAERKRTVLSGSTKSICSDACTLKGPETFQLDGLDKATKFYIKN